MTHEIVLRARNRHQPHYLATVIALSCTCLCTERGSFTWIDSRPRFPAAEAIAEWRGWHEREGIPL